MNAKIEEILSAVKINELIRKNEMNEEKKRNLCIALAVFAAVLAVIHRNPLFNFGKQSKVSLFVRFQHSRQKQQAMPGIFKEYLYNGVL